MKKYLIDLAHTDLTGVTTFAYNLVKLSKRNFDVCFPLIDNSIIIQQFKLLDNCRIIENPKDEYDIIFLNYFTEKYDSFHSKKYQFIHGLMSPVLYKINKGIEKLFVFSERALEYLNHDNICLIRNFIDLNRYVPSEINKVAKNVLIHDSRSNNFLLNNVISACAYLGMYVSFIGQDRFNRKLWNVENRIKDADIVIGYGRSTIEGLACGKSVIIYGINGGDGMLLENNYREMLHTNLSGWSMRTMTHPSLMNVEEIVVELLKYNKEQGEFNRKIAERHFDFKIYEKALFD